jgi:hypothetical protein
MKDVIKHPNTPDYIQALMLMIATCGGINYLKRRREERKFDIVVNAYKYSVEAYHVLKNLKQPPMLCTNRKQINDYKNIGNIQFASLFSKVASSYVDNLKKEQSLFDNLYESYVEMNLFFPSRPQVIKPMSNLLYSRDRISGLLDNIVSAGQQVENTTNSCQDKWIDIIDDAVVQIWENIELTESQKNKEVEIEEEDGNKFKRKYYYLDAMLDKAIKSIEEDFPRLIKT